MIIHLTTIQTRIEPENRYAHDYCFILSRLHRFYEILRLICNFQAGRCGHRPLQSLGEFVLPRKFWTQS